MKNEIKEIQIIESGEGLYLQPIAFDEKNWKNNKVIYYYINEFPPYDHLLNLNTGFWGDHWLKSNWKTYYCGGSFIRKLLGFFSNIWRFFIYQFLRFRYNFFNKIVLGIKECWNYYYYESKFRAFCRFKTYYNIFVPFVGVEFFIDKFWVNCQLMVKDDGSNFTETVYLKPSQKYLEKRVSEWVEEALKLSDEPKEEAGKSIKTFNHLRSKDNRNVFLHCSKKIAFNFIVWKKKCQDNGWKIYYIAELET